MPDFFIIIIIIIYCELALSNSWNNLNGTLFLQHIV